MVQREYFAIPNDDQITLTDLEATRHHAGYWTISGHAHVHVTLPDGRVIMGMRHVRIGSLQQIGRKNSGKE